MRRGVLRGTTFHSRSDRQEGLSLVFLLGVSWAISFDLWFDFSGGRFGFFSFFLVGGRDILIHLSDFYFILLSRAKPRVMCIF